MRKIGVGIIGFGTIGEQIARLLAQRPDFQVVAAWDPSAEGAQRIEAFDRACRRGAAEEVVAAPGELIYIASPPATHLEYLRLAAGAGKAILCEKPLAVDVEEAAATVDRLERAGVRAAVNFGFAVSPPVRALWDALRAGRIGEVRQARIEASFRVWPRPWQRAGGWLAGRQEGGFVREVLSHFVFLAQRLLGALRVERSRVDFPADGVTSETAIEARLIAGNIPLDLSACVGGEEDDFNAFTLIGERGAGRTHHWYNAEIQEGEGWVELCPATPEQALTRNRAALLDHLAAMMQGGSHALPGLREALSVQSCIERLLAAGVTSP
ncbi:Gfo/Idh/MocA family protein [Sorangium sp. So ce1000]|uniref:Gfo/Idh/MocA family protein n=1 Tax=Sorangium sp. So ce1000 TaxID=3133325 RepID=UPI003F5E220A